MSTAEEQTCPICRDARQDIARVTPCNHMFCVGCIQRWARLRSSCPLCRTEMTTIKVSVWGDEHFMECVVSPPAVPVPAGFRSGPGPDGTAAAAPSRVPQPPEHRDVEPEVGERVGGLLPEQWAAVFREHRYILDTVLPWLRQQLTCIPGLRRWQLTALEVRFLVILCEMGLDREVTIDLVQPLLAFDVAPLIDLIFQVIVNCCGQQARRLLGLEDDGAAGGQEDSPAAASTQGTFATSATPSGRPAGPDLDELPGTSSGTLRRGASELRAAPSPGEQEPSHEKPGLEAAGPAAQGCSSRSTPRQGSKRSSGGTRRCKKRKAGSTQDAPRPCKRTPPR
ncbi:TOPRS ligase, partial [Alectura lathami]|nr:TOPRS ligase [Alectura lathami]